MARAEAEQSAAVRLACAVIVLAVVLSSCGGQEPAGPQRGQQSPKAAGQNQGTVPPQPPGPNGAATARCDRVASLAGSDGNIGTAGSPYRSVQHLADSLSSGQTGCLRSGVFDLDDEIKVVHPGITLTAYPGEQATVKGRLWIAAGADDVTVSNLYLDGRSSFNRGPTVDAANVTFDRVDITNHHAGICLILGSNSGFGTADGALIQNSRIHDCGELPSTNQAHGIYVAAGEGVVIRNNWIYDNADRGIQLYPNSQGTRVYGNVIDANGEGIVIAGNSETASSGNLIENNVISDSKVRWNVEANWVGGLVGSGNVVRSNCVWPSNPDSYYNRNGGVMPAYAGAEGFTASGNVTVEPRFVDRAADDLRLGSHNGCLPLP